MKDFLSVGNEVILKPSYKGLATEIIGAFSHAINDKVRIVGMDKDLYVIEFCGQYMAASVSCLHPLPERIDLVNGEFYVFSTDYQNHPGRYQKSNNRFYYYGGSVDANDCDNIVHLIPEVK